MPKGTPLMVMPVVSVNVTPPGWVVTHRLWRWSGLWCHSPTGYTGSDCRVPCTHSLWV